MLYLLWQKHFIRNNQLIINSETSVRIIDESNFNNASDFVISFPKIETENTISEYRLFITNYNDNFDKEQAENITSNFHSITPTGNDYNINFPNNIVDINGNTLVESSTYKAHILSITDGHFSDFNSFSERSNYFSFHNPAFIYVGQTEGLTYIDIVPDTILYPAYFNTEIFEFDINEDNINDYSINSIYESETNYRITEMLSLNNESLFYLSPQFLDVISPNYEYFDYKRFSYWMEGTNSNPYIYSTFASLNKTTEDEVTYGWVHFSVEDYKKVSNSHFKDFTLIIRAL